MNISQHFLRPIEIVARLLLLLRIKLAIEVIRFILENTPARLEPFLFHLRQRSLLVHKTLEMRTLWTFLILCISSIIFPCPKEHCVQVLLNRVEVKSSSRRCLLKGSGQMVPVLVGSIKIHCQNKVLAFLWGCPTMILFSFIPENNNKKMWWYSVISDRRRRRRGPVKVDWCCCFQASADAALSGTGVTGCCCCKTLYETRTKKASRCSPFECFQRTVLPTPTIENETRIPVV